MKRYEELIRSMEVPARRTTDEAWSRLRQRIDEESATPVRNLNNRNSGIWKWAAAASIAVLMAVAAWMFFMQEDLVTETSPVGQITMIDLQDGSQVGLAGGSKVVYNPERWNETRRIELKGKAFFSVTKGSPFVVSLEGERSVEVLGTQFTVSEVEGFEVDCTTGKVRVNSGRENATIEGGEGVTETSEGLNRKRVDPHKASAWANGEFDFEETPLKKVCRQVESAYGVKIEAESDVDETLFSGKFQAKSAEEAVNIICQVLRLDYVQDQERYKLIPEQS